LRGEVITVVKGTYEENQMAFSGYIKIADIKGGSTEEKHKDWCELLTCTHSMRQPSAGSRSLEGGGATGDVEHSEWTFTKHMDCASPKVYEALNKGTHLDKVEVELVRPGGDPLVYMKFTLENVLVTSVEMEGNLGSEKIYPTEKIGLTYDHIQWDYDKQDAKGKSAGKVATKFSLAKVTAA